MIHYNKGFENKEKKLIKHRCKIKSVNYYIQISINAIKPYERIIFFIKCKDNISHSTSYKREFLYNELINYNKKFSYFSSINNIFTNISQSIQENKFSITNNIKCLSLTMKMYIKKKKKYININVNLNKHTKLKPLSFSVFKYKDAQRVSLGIQNEKEIRNALQDIRKRLNKIEKNQNIINSTIFNNTNINNINDGNINNNDNNNNKINNYNNNNIDMNNIKNDNTNDNNINNIGNKSINNKDNNESNSKDINNSNIDNNNDKNNINNINNNSIDKHNMNDININNKNKNIFDNNVNNNEENINDINKSNINNSNIYKNDYSEVNINHIDNKNILNEPNYNPNSILGMSKMMMKKLNDLEKSIYNKDDKIEKLEKRLKYLHSQDKYSRNIVNLKLSNFKNGSIDNYNYNNNKISSFYPNQSSGNLDKSNDISIINKINDKNINFYHNNMSQDVGNNNDDSPIRNKYNNYNNQNISVINNITDISDISKIDKRKHRHHSSSNHHRKHHKSLNTSEINDNTKEMNIYDNNLRIEENKNQYKVKSKGYKRHHSSEKHKHKLSKVKSDNKTNRGNNYRSDMHIDKYKNIKNNHSVEKIRKKRSNKDNSYEVIESETNNQFSYLYKNTNNNITEEMSRNYINKNNKKHNSSNIQIIKPKNSLNKSINNIKNINNNRSSENISKISKISLYPREEIKKYVNSRIIFRKNELRLLKDKISNNDKKLHVFFDLLYRASKDGDKELTIREKIQDYYETLTLFYTKEGARFGVYLKRIEAHSFIKGKNYKEVPGSCFLVGLNNLVIYQIDKNKTSNDNFKDVLCFGRTFYLNKNGTNWMIFTPQNKFLGEKCIIGKGEGLFTNIDIEELVGDYEYHIKDVEIFNVSIEK